MEVSSVQRLCEILIYYSIQRCRMHDDLCRISVALKPCLESNPALTRVSVSDTGVGSTLEEFQDLRYAITPVLASKWSKTSVIMYQLMLEPQTCAALIFYNAFSDGMISVATTSIFDNELHHINVNLNEVTPSRRLTKLPSSTKNGAKFSGTEVSLLTSEGVDDLLAKLTFFVQKMLVLKYPKVAIELLVYSGSTSRSEYDRHALAIECSSLPSSMSYLESLKLGFENYVLKHGYQVNDICYSCFPTREHLKVGTGVACCSGSRQSSGQIVEAVVVIRKYLAQASPSCCRIGDTKTEILYFEDFAPSSISQSSLDALTKIKWKSYGSSLRSIFYQDGRAYLEWENLPPQVHINVVLHSYHKQVGKLLCARSRQLVGTPLRKAVLNALNQLKEKNEGVLLSARALKICNYAPDLAKTIAQLILSSNDLNFKGECFSLLGIQFPEMEENVVEHSIRERIISAIGINDREPRRKRDDTANILFEDDCFQTSHLLDEAYVEGDEEEFSSLDL